MQKWFAFDLDGTVTCEETLPLLARELDLVEEMERLTRLTLEGRIPFTESFSHRFRLLREIPVARIREIMDSVRLDEDISGFIRRNRESCAIVTGNLDVWIEPMIGKLGCRCYSSVSSRDADGGLVLEEILDKAGVVRTLQEKGGKVIAVGDSFNDIPMFRAADVAIAYGGIHPLTEHAASAADYAVSDGGELCRLLERLSMGSE